MRARPPIRPLAALLCALLPLACATSPDRAAQPAGEGRAPAAQPAWSDTTRIAYASRNTSLDQAVRFLGEQHGVGLVTVQGTDVRAVPALETERMPYGEFVAWLAGAVECQALREPHYYFLAPPGYELLLETRVDAPLPKPHDRATLSAAFGFNTLLFNVFASLTHSTGYTIATDNILGEQRVGELNVPDAPLARVLEAVLRSARVAPDGFRAELGPNYLFLASAPNRSLAQPLLNVGDLPAGLRKALDRKIDLDLPARPADAAGVPFAPATLRLADVLPLLSAAFGVEVRATDAVADLPVNPCAMRGVRVEDAMRLLIRQWPLPHYGYEARAEGLLILARRIGEHSAPPPAQP
jgi:hypothetical protein